MWNKEGVISGCNHFDHLFLDAHNESNSDIGGQQQRLTSGVLLKPGVYITHCGPWPLSDITGGNLSGYIQLPLEPHKASYHFFTYAAVLPKTCKNTLMYTIWEIKGAIEIKYYGLLKPIISPSPV